MCRDIFIGKEWRLDIEAALSPAGSFGSVLTAASTATSFDVGCWTHSACAQGRLLSVGRLLSAFSPSTINYQQSAT